MNKKTSKTPPRILKIRKDREYDCVYIGKQKIMLGRSGSPEAEAAYRQLQIQVLTDPSLASLKPEQVPVDNLCLAYLKYAEEHDPDHYFGIKTAVEILLKHNSGQAVDILDIGKRVTKHISTINLIPDGQRNTTLYLEGLTLKKLGLTGNALKVALRKINQMKCTTPLTRMSGGLSLMAQLTDRCGQSTRQYNSMRWHNALKDWSSLYRSNVVHQISPFQLMIKK